MRSFRFIIVLLVLWMVPSVVSYADVADPTPITVMTSAGEKTLRPVGDEHGHWLVDEDGNEYSLDENGVFVPSGGRARQRRLMKLQKPSMAYAKNDFGIKVEGFEAKGEVVIPVILAFSDQFSLHNKASVSLKVFYEFLLNNVSGAPSVFTSWQVRGSLRDYWSDNSFGAFTPKFKIFTVSSSKLESCGGLFSAKRTLEWYGKNGSDGTDANKFELFKDAVSLLKSELSADKELTRNSSGKFASVIIIYPGCGENEDASRPNLIWPCAWNDGENYNYSSSGLTFQTVALCNEISSLNRPDMGTLCHEFGHCTGLPDFYDVDKEANGTHAHRVGAVDLMDGGSSKIVPPPLTCVERYLYFSKLWPAASKNVTGDYAPYSRITLPGIGQSGHFLMFTARNNSKEYLFVEAHLGYKWDNVIGLYFYHVDMSSNRVSVNSSTTAADLWAENQGMNNYDGHSCYRNAHEDNYGCRPYDYSGKAFGVWFSNYYNSGGSIAVNYAGHGWGGNSPASGKVRMVFKFYADHNGVNILDDVSVVCNGKTFDDSKCKEGGLKGIYELEVNESEFNSSSLSITVSKPGYETKVITKKELDEELDYISESERTTDNPGYVFFACKLLKDDTPVYSTLSYPAMSDSILSHKTPYGSFSVIQRIPMSFLGGMDSSTLRTLSFPSLGSFAEGLEYNLRICSGNLTLYEVQGASAFTFSNDSKQLFLIPDSGDLTFRLDFKGDGLPQLILSRGADGSVPAEIINEGGIVSILPGTFPVDFIFLQGTAGQKVSAGLELLEGIRILDSGAPEGRYKLYLNSAEDFVRFSVNGKDYALADSFLLMAGLNRLELVCGNGKEFVSWIYYPF